MVEKKFYLYFLFHFSIAFLLFCALIVGSFELLNLYTRQGEGVSVFVPQVVGKTIEKLMVSEENELFDVRFTVIDSAYVPGKLPGEILRQYPTAFFIHPLTKEKEQRKIKEGKLISLVINRLAPPLVSLPSFYAKPAKEIRLTLREMGFKINKENQINIGLCPDCVVQILDQNKNNLIAGEKINQETELTLIIDAMGMKEKQFVNLPSLEGLSLMEAQQLIRENRLNVGTISSDQPYDQNSRVIKQNPNPKDKKQVATGTYVHLIVE